MKNLHVAQHPLISHKLTMLRDKNTDTKMFRELISEISMLLFYEATRDLNLTKTTVETPVASSEFDILENDKFTIVPILRAGVGMTSAIQSLIPSARIGVLGMYRNEETFNPVVYYCKLPEDITETSVFVIDPMLATGGSSIAALDHLKKLGCKNIKFLSIIAAPEGVENLSREHNDIEIFTAALDIKLNEKNYIVPGLGDAGDRIFGT